jgi:hypothetical protein
MLGTSVAKLKTDLGLMPSRIGAAHPLKACRECAAEESHRLGFAMWHAEHQWPSVWICRQHSAFLQALRNEKQLKSLRRYELPDDVHKDEWPTTEFSAPGAKKLLLKLSTFSNDLIGGKTPARYRPEIVRYAALTAAAKRQWIAPDGSMRFHQIRDAFMDYYRGLESVPGLGFLITVEKDHGGPLGTMLRQYNGVRHPLKQILLICFFFESQSAFHDAYQSAIAEMEGGNVSRFGVPPNLEWRKRLKRMVEVERKSMNQAATSLGIPLPLAIRWANKDGINYNRRPRILTVETEKALRDLILTGMAADEIVRIAGVKRSFLRSFLAKDFPLRDIWRGKMFEKQRESRRRAFLVLLEKQRGLPMALLKRIPGNDFAWLSRNDHDWLSRNLPHLT